MEQVLDPDDEGLLAAAAVKQMKHFVVFTQTSLCIKSFILPRCFSYALPVKFVHHCSYQVFFWYFLGYGEKQKNQNYSFLNSFFAHSLSTNINSNFTQDVFLKYFIFVLLLL